MIEKIWPGNNSVFQKLSGIEKKLWIRGGISRFSLEFCMAHSAEKFRKGILLFLRKFLVSKNFMDERRDISFFHQKVLVSQCRKISWAFPHCFRKSGVSKIFMHNKGCNVFPSKIFGLTVPKSFVGILSMFQKIWGIEKFYA